MVRDQLAARGIKDPGVLEAMGDIPRERFVPPELVEHAYADGALTIGGGQTISQPYIVARMSEALRLEARLASEPDRDEGRASDRPHPRPRVLEIGTGSGYQAAILARMGATVVTVERDARLAAEASKRLADLGYEGVTVELGDGSAGWPVMAPYDAILVAAACPEAPEPLLAELADGGRLVAPVGSRDDPGTDGHPACRPATRDRGPGAMRLRAAHRQSRVQRLIDGVTIGHRGGQRMTNELATRLADRVRGRVIVPGDLAYDGARATFNGMIDRRPRIIVRPVDTADVADGVRWAADEDLPLAIRGGGHSVSGHSMPEDAVVIDLSSMRGVTVDPASETADALGGSLLMDLDVATAAYGFAVPSGTFLDTGVGGLTLSGGISYLVASEGFACDALVGAELVSADGSIIQVDEAREPDLLWALRGGGGNFGVVTHLRFRLTKVERMYGGVLRFRGDGVADVLRRLFDLDRSAPDELSLQAVAWHSEETQAAALTVIVAWRGEAESGTAAIRPLRDHPALFEDDVHAMSWLQLQANNTPIPFGMRNYWKGHFVRETTQALADAIIEAGAAAGDEDGVLVELVHGRAHRIPADSAAFGGRLAVANVTALGIWSDAADDDRSISWARAAAASFEPFSLSGGGYLNYAETDQSAARVAAAFGPEAFGRLQLVKRRYDPTNRFRFNGNIPPA